MADLTIPPSDVATFVDQLLDHNVILPLRLCDEEVGSVLDDDGQEIFVVDPNRERSDLESSGIAVLIVQAVNVCGGFGGEQANG